MIETENARTVHGGRQQKSNAIVGTILSVKNDQRVRNCLHRRLYIFILHHRWCRR